MRLKIRKTKRSRQRVGSRLTEEDKDYPKKGADYKDEKVKGRRDDRGRKEDYYSGGGYNYRDQSDSYDEYKPTGYTAKSHTAKRDKPHKEKYTEKRIDDYFVKKDNKRYEAGTEYYVKSEATKTDQAASTTSPAEQGQPGAGSRTQAAHTDHRDHKNDNIGGTSAKAHQQEPTSNHKGGSAKKHKYFEDDESGDDQIYHALIQGQKQDIHGSGKNHSQEHPQYGHHTSQRKESGDTKMNLRGQQSSGTKNGSTQHHAQDKAELIPPPGMSQKGRDNYQRNDEYGRDLQVNKTRSREQQSSYAHSNHIGGHINGRDDAIHEAYVAHQTHSERKNSHHATHTQAHGSLNSSPHQAAGSVHSPVQNLAIGSQPLGQPQTPLIYMPQTVTQTGPDGTQIQQTIMVPMMVQPQGHSQTSAQTPQIPSFSPALPFGLGGSIQGLWQSHSQQSTSHTGSLAPTTIYCLVPIQVVPYTHAAN